jgi:streptomycin 6-kinase
VAKRQEITLSKGLAGSSSQDSQNMNPNIPEVNASHSNLIAQQQAVWAEELRRADERALKFKSDLVEADSKR